MFDERPEALAEVREHFSAFTVDEYQDVNLLQQMLLDRWLGHRDELCAVGDDYQSIYAFTGATPAYLLGLPTRFPNATVIRLEDNYRSSPQVLALANRIVPALGGAEKIAACHARAGPEPVTQSFPAREGEIAFVVDRVRALHGEGVAARGDRRPLAYERPAGRLRGAAARGEDPLPGRVSPRARGRAPTAPPAATHRLGRRCRHRAGYAKDAAGVSNCRRSSASARWCASPISDVSFGWPKSSTTASGRPASSSPTSRLGSARRERTGAASISSRCTGRKGSSSRRSSSRDSRRRSCRSDRPRSRARSPRSGGSSTSG